MSEPLNQLTNDLPGDNVATVRVQQLFVRHQSIIKAFILSLQPGFSEAEDVLQETFLLITKRSATYREGTNFVAWACAIARFKLFEARRKSSAPALTEEALALLCEEAPDVSFFDERLSVLRNCLHQLAPRARELVWHRYHGEMASEEIARQLKWKETAVRVALSKARMFLRDCVQRQLRKGQV